MTQIASAGIDEIVVSWWAAAPSKTGGCRSSPRPRAARPARRDPPRALRGSHARSVALDLGYLASFGVRDAYVYHPRTSGADWAAVRGQVPSTMQLFAATEKVGFAAAGRFDGVYTYDFLTNTGAKFARLCAQAHVMHLACAPSVGPATTGTAPASRRRAGRARTAPPTTPLDGGARAHPDIVSITSFNEWARHPDRARPGPARLTSPTTAPGAS